MKIQDPYEVAAGAIVGHRAWLRELLAELSGLVCPAFSQARSAVVAVAYVAALLAVAGDPGRAVQGAGCGIAPAGPVPVTIDTAIRRKGQP